MTETLLEWTTTKNILRALFGPVFYLYENMFLSRSRLSSILGRESVDDGSLKYSAVGQREITRCGISRGRVAEPGRYHADESLITYTSTSRRILLTESLHHLVELVAADELVFFTKKIGDRHFRWDSAACHARTGRRKI